jgi:serine/threonine protein kinase
MLRRKKREQSGNSGDNRPSTSAGWRPDPTGRFQMRYWDGATWTSNVALVGGAVQHDPVPVSASSQVRPLRPTILGAGDHLRLATGRTDCVVHDFIGGGSEGEVFTATISADPATTYALKWYHPGMASDEQRESLLMLIKTKRPSDRFYWPIDLASSDIVPDFGYIMPLMEPELVSLCDLMSSTVEESFRVLARVGLEAADAMLLLHSQGLCYRDISFGNLFFNPHDGRVAVCDCDNIRIDGTAPPRVFGTPRFIAPEVLRSARNGSDLALPSIQTDRHSLAVLLFYLLIRHDPFLGKNELLFPCFDDEAARYLYEDNPIFIFDPDDTSNQPDPIAHPNAVLRWPLFPRFIQDYFRKSFTEGLRDPVNGRVTESEWRYGLARLRDIVSYHSCGAENFVDIEGRGGAEQNCWSCGLALPPNVQLKLDRPGATDVVVLNYDTELYEHHLGRGPSDRYSYERPCARVNRHPEHPNIWGLTNLTTTPWQWEADQTSKPVPPGATVRLTSGSQLKFGDHLEGSIIA